MNRLIGALKWLCVLLIFLVATACNSGAIAVSPTAREQNTVVVPSASSPDILVERTSVPTAVITGTPQTDSPGAMRQVREAISTTSALERYHFTMKQETDASDEPTVRDGEYVAPDSGHIRATASDGRTLDMLWLGDRIYTRATPGEKWVLQHLLPTPTSNASSSSSLSDSFALQIFGLDRPDKLERFTFRDAGEQNVGGQALLYFVGQEADYLGRVFDTMSFWIDPSTKYIHQIYDIQSFAPHNGTALPTSPTPTSPGFSKIFTTVTLDRFNDPSVTLPAPLPTP